MHPILFSLGKINIYSYGLMVAIGIVISVLFIEKQAEVYGIDKEKVIDLIFWTVIWGLVGGRVLYVLLYPGIYLQNPMEILKIYEGGLVFFGSLFFGIAAAFVNFKTKKLPVLKTIDLLILYVPLAHAFGRVGCFLNGCCGGKPTDCFLGVTFPGHSQSVHPTQLYSVFGLLLIFFILKKIQSKQKFPGQIFAGYLILYPIFRFSIEFLRVNPRVFFGLSVYQIISLLIFTAGVSVYKIMSEK